MPTYILILFPFIPFLVIFIIISKNEVLRGTCYIPFVLLSDMSGLVLRYFRGIRVFYSAQHSLQRYYTPPPINYSSVGLPIIMHLWRFSRETKLVGIIWSNINLYIKRERGGERTWREREVRDFRNGLTWLWSLLTPKSAGWAGWGLRGEVMSQLESESDLLAEFPLFRHLSLFHLKPWLEETHSYCGGNLFKLKSTDVNVNLIWKIVLPAAFRHVWPNIWVLWPSQVDT